MSPIEGYAKIGDDGKDELKPADRARYAARALHEYNNARETDIYQPLDPKDIQLVDTAETDLIDLLADLRHLADVLEVDIYRALEVSYKHYLEEKKGGE